MSTTGSGIGERVEDAIVTLYESERRTMLLLGVLSFGTSSTMIYVDSMYAPHPGRDMLLITFFFLTTIALSLIIGAKIVKRVVGGAI